MPTGPGTPALVEALRQVSQHVQSSLQRAAAAGGVSVAQARLLIVLRDRAPTLGELAELLDLDKSSTSGLVDRAQLRGLVRRVRSQVDHRSVRVRLSEQGRVLADEVELHLTRALTALLGAVPAQEHGALAAALGAVAADADGRGGALGKVDRDATAATERPAPP